MTPDPQQLVSQLLSTTGPLGVLACLVWWELQSQGETLVSVQEQLAVCIAQTGASSQQTRNELISP